MIDVWCCEAITPETNRSQLPLYLPTTLGVIHKKGSRTEYAQGSSSVHYEPALLQHD